MGAFPGGSLPDAQTLGAKVGRDQQIRFLGKLTGLRLGDRRQIAQVQIGQTLHRPVIGLPSIRVDAVGDELLAQAQHFDGRGT